jgi:hypothetical protein
LPEQWKESIIVPIYKKGNKNDCSNHQEISLLSTAYMSLSNILLSRLSLYIDEIIGDHEYRFKAIDVIRYSAFVRYWRNEIGKVYSAVCRKVTKVFFMLLLMDAISNSSYSSTNSPYGDLRFHKRQGISSLPEHSISFSRMAVLHEGT